ANFATALMLGIAYSASIGSLATIIGTPPNTFVVGYLKDEHDIEIGFGQWMLFGLPIAIVLMVLTWLILTKVVFRPGIKHLPGTREVLHQQLRDMGPMSRGEWTVLVVFVLGALSWVFIPTLADLGPVAEAMP